jgi:nucleoside-diphosphate-sugar epimerase
MTDDKPSVLLTGATGLIGRHCIPALIDRGFDVHAVSRNPGAQGGPASFHAADLTDPEGAAELIGRLKPSHLLHLAWDTTPGEYLHSRQNEAWLDSGRAMVDVFCRAGGRRIVAAGTCFEYAFAPRPLVETDPLDPQTPYARAKVKLAEYLRSQAESCGFSWAWGRIFYVFGPGEHAQRLVPAIITQLLQGLPAACSHGRQIRDYMLSLHIAQAFAALLDSDVTGPVNIARGEKTTVGQIAGTLGRIIERPEMVRLGALPARAEEPPAIYADVSRLTEQVGYRPTQTLEVGLRSTVHWWRQRMGQAEQI